MKQRLASVHVVRKGVWWSTVQKLPSYDEEDIDAEIQNIIQVFSVRE